MVVRRGAAPPPSDDESSSSSDDDAFSAVSRKKQNKKGRKSEAAAEKPAVPAPAPTPAPATKRHHHVSSARQAKMDALLQELQEAEKQSSAAGVPAAAGAAGHYGPASGYDRPPPDKKGSYVEPGTEHLTTNIFVGNLSPSTTEEELTEAFRQFGDLYSVKIMWPRTAEERARGRNTGFVCFMVRSDAQEAMDALQESDPLDTGRRMCLRWGKNVKKTVKRGTGGVPIPPIRRKGRAGGKKGAENEGGGGGSKRRKVGDGTMYVGDADQSTSSELDTGAIHPPSNVTEAAPLDHLSGPPLAASAAFAVAPSKPPKAKRPPPPVYDPVKHSADAIRVVAPSEPYRLKFITTVASFVAKDGSILERKLAEKESANPKFSFLSDTAAIPSEVELNERIFYRWRVYAFAQGDGLVSWRTEPFVMILPHGRFWIPPPLDREAAARELAEAKLKEEEILVKQEERRKLNEKKDFMTGRQLEHAKYGGGAGTATEGAAKLNDYEMETFDGLVRKKLCASRDAICEAMAFCFDKSGAAMQLSSLLKEFLLEDGPAISPETRIARLYLLSDVLFNSQQPGVRNAFRYRDAIEAMAPEVFSSLGKHGQGQAGRMTMNKLRNAVSGVLSAWTNWSVYNHTFLDELQARFEGKDVDHSMKNQNDATATDANEVDAASEDDATGKEEVSDEPNRQTKTADAPRGDWMDADVDGNVDGEPIDDVDGEALEDADVDGEPLEEDVDGVPLDANIDGEAIDDDDIDGEALADDDDVDGEPLHDSET